MFWIGGLAYKYHLETEEIRKLQEVDIKAKARELNDFIYNENKKLKKENEYMKDTPYEFIRDNGEKEYYNLFAHQLVKKIDKDDTIWEYDKNNGLLLKKTDKYNNVEEYGLHGKLIKKTLSDGVWMEYNSVNKKLMKRKNIDNSIEEFHDNEEKFKEIDKNGKVKFFKTKLYQNISDFKKLNLTARQLKDIGFTFQQIKEVGYTAKELKDAGSSLQELKASAQQEQETFNNILKKIESEVESLTTEQEIVYHPGGKTIKHIKILDSKNKKEIKRIIYHDDGKTINQIWETNPEGTIIKATYYQDDAKTINLIKEINPEGKPTQITYYNPDGTVKETINY
ncbi:MAG: hypothetical protein QS2022_5280 [Candidatus Phytoplasma asteris]|uniref:DUF2963 domain-containing protein n=2 Tax=16SrI (Aster yellows group) TaxID=3042590 RepID=Q6YQB6_ONYPE|nr:DUF2963 domain-containing protein ['Chrysanthemum coronarium' phytoplasma]TKA87845.1 MAG: hypothetical protein PLY_5270 [Periwinkle leaf yellowing phytoplasma]WEX19770.1 MAG: hypothetical protein QS2022_5280 [Candidatus Phytoplasma asteris]BAD04544.1 conserved hypothetical protein [Onion yellows phytoplasma OY-M]GAK74251.1 hypothetical protein OYV_07510 ['Chrysanthemum coronarium' phytoplasma]